MARSDWTMLRQGWWRRTDDRFSVWWKRKHQWGLRQTPIGDIATFNSRQAAMDYADEHYPIKEEADHGND